MILNKRLIFFPIIILCLVLVGCSTPEEKKERHYLKALEYIKQEKPKAAILELRNAIQIDEKYADARYQLGLLYLQEENPRQAFQELIRAANLDHQNFDANLKAAELYFITRDFKESRKLLERILEKDPRHQEALALLANIELIEGSFDQALKTLEEIGDSINTSPKLLNIKGRIHAAKNQFAKAEDAFKKAIALDDDKFEYYSTLLVLYQRTGANKSTEALLEEMTKKFPDDPRTYLLLASYHRSIGNHKQVEKELLKALDIAPENPHHHLMLANYYKENRAASKAIDILLNAQEQFPENLDIQVALATIYFEIKNVEEAQTLLEQVLAKKENNGKAKLLKARFLLSEGKLTDSIEILENLNNDFPNWADPFYYLALARFSLGEIDLAQIAANTAVQKKSNESKYHALLAQIYLLKNVPAAAQTEAAKALKLNPNNLRAAIILTTTLIDEESYDKAIDILTQMDKQVPENLEILGNLAIATLRSGDKEKAEEVLEEILEISPGNNRAALLLTRLKYEDDLVGAQDFISQQIDKAPENSGLHVILGDILLRQEKPESALEAYKKALSVAPDNMKAYIATANVLKSLGRKDEAMATYNSMIAQNPKWIQGYMGVAMLYASQGNSQKAQEYYAKALENQPDFAPAANNLAWLIASNPDGDLAEALRLALIAKKKLPDSPQIADTLGYVYLKRGSYSLAIPQFELAHEKLPEDPTITYHLASALAEDGQKEKAFQLLRKLLDRNVNFAEREQAEMLLANLKQ